MKWGLSWFITYEIIWSTLIYCGYPCIPSHETWVEARSSVPSQAWLSDELRGQNMEDLIKKHIWSMEVSWNPEIWDTKITKPLVFAIQLWILDDLGDPHLGWTRHLRQMEKHGVVSALAFGFCFSSSRCAMMMMMTMMMTMMTMTMMTMMMMIFDDDEYENDDDCFWRWWWWLLLTISTDYHYYCYSHYYCSCYYFERLLLKQTRALKAPIITKPCWRWNPGTLAACIPGPYITRRMGGFQRG